MAPGTTKVYELDVMPYVTSSSRATNGVSDLKDEEGGATASTESTDSVSVNVERGPTMKRELGVLGGISLIIGGIIGSGIFVSPAGVLEATGSVGLSLVVWVGAGLIALMGSLCYSELGTLIPKSGGDYSYVREAFGDMFAFIYVWVSILLVRPSSLAIMSLTFGTYFAAVFKLCGSPQIFERLAAVVCLGTVMLLNCYSTKLASRATVISTGFKVLSLLVIVAGGVYKMAQGKTGTPQSTYHSHSVRLQHLCSCHGSEVGDVSEQVYQKDQDHPADVGSRQVSGRVYRKQARVGKQKLNMELTERLYLKWILMLNNIVWGDRVLKEASVLIPIFVMISTFGAVNASAFAGGRPVFAAARDGNLPGVFSYIHVEKLTPLPSMVFTVCLAVVFVFLGDINNLIDFFSFTAWFFYGMNFVALLVFRVTKRDHDRPYKCPIVVPIVMVLISVYLVIAPIINEPSMGYLYATIFTVGSVLIYFPFVKYKLKFPFTDEITTYIQLVLEVVPATKFTD
ncbi:hypothetical protein EGW08_000024 [Elysia chlorotica]|uniref:Amino acid permease/ SLC12A domain-containing protein n=1 Tax=Elysia chlorotica TaxID=188477 RepID=A0A3S1BVG9_ELYCH|nr:hypothetical protein EGW08_000024 [Elysia chlorotica]